MKRCLFLFALLTASLAAAQTVTISGTKIQNLAGEKLAAGTICAQAVNLSGVVLNFGAPGGGQITRTDKCVAVTNGAFTLANVPDSTATVPANLCLNLFAKDRSGQVVLGKDARAAGYFANPAIGYTCVQTAQNNDWCTNGACDFDRYPPNLAPLSLVQTGPPGPAGPAGPPGPIGTIPPQPVDVGVSYNGKPGAATVLVRHVFPFAATVPQNCTGSVLVAEIAPAVNATFTLLKNGVQFGSAIIQAGQTTATFSCASATSFGAGTDVLKLVTPSPADSNLADLGVTLYATR